MNDVAHTAVQWLGLVLIAFAAIAAFGALAARSAFAMVMYFAVTAVMGATALAALGAGEAGLGLALVGIATAPFLLLSAVMLSARTSKRGAFPWMSAGLGAVSLVPIGWALAELREAPSVTSQVGISGLWLALLVFVVAAALIGVLGFGERGVMQRRTEAMRYEN